MIMLKPPGDLINNITYLKDTEYSIQISRWLLKPIGAWPRSASTSRAEKAIAGLIPLICHIVIAFTVVPCALYILLEAKDIKLKLKNIGPLSHWTMGGINYISLLSNTRKIGRCVQDIEMDWRLVKRVADRDLMLDHAKYGRLVAGFSALCMHFGVASYAIIMGFTPLLVVVDNETIPMRQLPCQFYSEILDTRFSPANEIVLITQLASGFIVNSVTVGACGLAAIFAMHARGQLNVVISWFDELVESREKGEKHTRERLASVVKHHLSILSFISRIEDIMHQVCLVELLGCTFNLCMLGYYILTESAQGNRMSVLIYSLIWLSMAFNIFIFCYIGDGLSEQCQMVGERAYMTEWYDLPHKTALSLILIISRSSIVIKITAGKLVPLSIPTFASVIKTSLAYLNILRTTSM